MAWVCHIDTIQLGQQTTNFSFWLLLWVSKLFDVYDAKEGTGFVPRPALQAVRNCTKLNRDVAVDIVKTLATTLLQQSDKLGHQCNSTSAAVSQCSSTAEWRRGGKAKS